MKSLIFRVLLAMGRSSENVESQKIADGILLEDDDLTRDMI